MENTLLRMNLLGPPNGKCGFLNLHFSPSSFRDCPSFVFCTQHLQAFAEWFKIWYSLCLAVRFFLCLFLSSSPRSLLLVDGPLSWVVSASFLVWGQEFRALPRNHGTWAGHCHPPYGMESSLLKNTRGERKSSFYLIMGIKHKREYIPQMRTLLKLLN